MTHSFRQLGAAALAMGALLLVPFTTQAQVPVKFTFAFSATYQAADVNSGADLNITKSSTKTVKFTSATLLSLLQVPAKNSLSVPIGGTALSVGNVSSVDAQGNSTDQSGAVNLTITNLVHTGVADTDKNTTAQVYTGSLILTVDDGGGNTVNVSGLVRITDTIAALSKSQAAASAPPTESVTISGGLAGSGSVVDSGGITEPALFSGSISGVGKGASNQ